MPCCQKTWACLILLLCLKKSEKINFRRKFSRWTFVWRCLILFWKLWNPKSSSLSFRELLLGCSRSKRDRDRQKILIIWFTIWKKPTIIYASDKKITFLFELLSGIFLSFSWSREYRKMDKILSYITQLLSMDESSWTNWLVSSLFILILYLFFWIIYFTFILFFLSMKFVLSSQN